MIWKRCKIKNTVTDKFMLFLGVDDFFMKCFIIVNIVEIEGNKVCRFGELSPRFIIKIWYELFCFIENVLDRCVGSCCADQGKFFNFFFL